MSNSTTNTKKRKKLVGLVVSNKMDKTAVLKVSNKILHKLYKKYVKTSKKYKFHDENNICNIGDIVQIAECRHISKEKYFELDKVLQTSEDSLS